MRMEPLQPEGTIKHWFYIPQQQRRNTTAIPSDKKWMNCKDTSSYNDQSELQTEELQTGDTYYTLLLLTVVSMV